MAQELLTTFAEKIGEVALAPGHSGVFEIRVDETLGFVDGLIKSVGEWTSDFVDGDPGWVDIVEDFVPAP